MWYYGGIDRAWPNSAGPLPVRNRTRSFLTDETVLERIISPITLFRSLLSCQKHRQPPPPKPHDVIS